jgi:serine protease Do
VQLGEQDKGEAVAAALGSQGGVQPGSTALGLSLRALTDQDRAQLGLPSDVEGALVARVAPDSAAAEKGIRPGDVITRVNQQTVTGVNDAVAALSAAKEDDETALLLVRRGDSQRFVALSFS